MWSKSAISLGIKVLLEEAGIETFLRPGEEKNPFSNNLDAPGVCKRNFLKK